MSPNIEVILASIFSAFTYSMDFKGLSMLSGVLGLTQNFVAIILAPSGLIDFQIGVTV